MVLWYTGSFGTRWPGKQCRDKSEATLNYAACNGPQIAMAWQLWEKEQQRALWWLPSVEVVWRFAAAGKDLSPSSACRLMEQPPHRTHGATPTFPAAFDLVVRQPAGSAVRANACGHLV